MSDWDFLHEMRERGYSSVEIADAAGCGLAPWDFEHVDEAWLDSQLKSEARESAQTVKQDRQFNSREGVPHCIQTQAEILEDLVDCAKRHLENTGRYLQVWGELGEIYAEVRFGLSRHATHRAGSDGTINGRLVEVKTISPEKSNSNVLVKSQSNFEQLLVVRIDSRFRFQSKLFDRNALKVSSEKWLRASLTEDRN